MQEPEDTYPQGVQGHCAKRQVLHGIVLWLQAASQSILSLAERSDPQIMSMHKALNVKSRVRRDFHARFCERVRVKLPRSTRPCTASQSILALAHIDAAKLQSILQTAQYGL